MPPEDDNTPQHYVDPQTGAEADENSEAVLDALLNKQGPKKGAEAEVKQPVKTEEVEQVDEELQEVDEPTEETEEEPEEEAEEETSDEDDDNIDNYKVVVTVDGEEKEVSLKDLKAAYSGNEYIAQNVQKAVEARKVLENQSAILYESNNKSIEKLKSLEAILDAVAKPDIDWDKLRAENPTEYLVKREEMRELQHRQELVRKEIEKTNNEQAEIQSQARQRFILDQGQLLATKLPVLKDPQKAPAVMKDVAATAKHFGFTDQELGSVMDHRQMLVLHAASEWLKEQDRKTRLSKRTTVKEEPSVKKVLIRPGTTKNSSGEASRRLTAQRLAKAQSSGNVDDVAATLLVRGKGRTPISPGQLAKTRTLV